jgi:hypothetical protein
MAEPEPDYSAARNYLSGSGCGCGCLGLLTVLLGTIIVGVIPLGFYTGSTTMPMIAGGATLVTGILVALLGIGMSIGALFMD